MTLEWLVSYHVPLQELALKSRSVLCPWLQSVTCTSFLCESIQQPCSLWGIKRSWPLENTRQMWTITVTVTASLSRQQNKELDFIKLGHSLRLKGPFPDPPILKKTNSISTSCWETQMGIEKQCCQPLSPSMVDDLLTCHPMIHYFILVFINCISPEALGCLISVLIYEINMWRELKFYLAGDIRSKPLHIC